MRAPARWLIVVCVALCAAAVSSFAVHAAPATIDAAKNDASAADRSNSALAGLPEPPKVQAKAWAVYDGTSMTLLAGKSPEAARPIASLTKMMTALVVVERTQGDEMVSISRAAQDAGDGSEIGVTVGQKYRVDDLLQAMLVYSANDAAIALAEYVGTTQDTFIEMMNERARELKLGHTTFTSVNGLDGPEGTKLTKSSPADVATLSDQALKDPRIRLAVKLRSVTIERPGTTPVTLTNRNELLGSVDGVDGVKTGFTDAAGRCLVVHWAASTNSDTTSTDSDTANTDSDAATTPADPNDNLDDLSAEEIADGEDSSSGATSGPDPDSTLWIVLLGEPDDPARFDDARALLEWATPLRQTVRFAESGDAIVKIPVEGSGKLETLYTTDAITAGARIGSHVVEKAVVPNVISTPIQEGDTVGRIDVYVDDEKVGSSSLYVGHTITGETQRERWKRYANSWDEALAEGVDTTQEQAQRFADYWGL